MRHTTLGRVSNLLWWPTILTSSSSSNTITPRRMGILNTWICPRLDSMRCILQRCSRFLSALFTINYPFLFVAWFLFEFIFQMHCIFSLDCHHTFLVFYACHHISQSSSTLPLSHVINTVLLTLNRAVLRILSYAFIRISNPYNATKHHVSISHYPSPLTV